MGDPKPQPVYFDKILINASQVTNPPIDPLREPMETRVFLGKKPNGIKRLPDGRIDTLLPPQISLSMPVMFSAMSYGSISYNAHAALAKAAEKLGICYNTGRGRTSRRLLSLRRKHRRSGCVRKIRRSRKIPIGQARLSKSKWGRAQSRVSAVICQRQKSWATSLAPV